MDALTPAPSTEALASAAGLAIAEPVAREIPGLTLQGIESVSLPAHENLMTHADGTPPTGALLQFPDKDHYIIYFDGAVRSRLFDFLASSVSDEGTQLMPAEETD